MTLSVAMTTFDCNDPTAVAGWWAEQTSGTLTTLAEGEFLTVEVPGSIMLGFQRVDTPTPGKNRTHIDFHSDDRDGDAARFIAAGATEIERHQMGPDFGWVVLSDPEGNVFCVGGA